MPKGYKDEVYDVIASLYSSDKSSDQQIIQKFSAAMKVENSRDIQADRWHAIKQLYEQVIKPRAHELRFGKVLSRLDFSNRQATAEQLANLLATSGFILSGSTVDFYTPAAILRAVTAVLTDIKGLNLANTISLQDFLKALAKERIRHLTDALSSLAHEFSQSAANNSSVAETCNTEQAALIAERKVLNSIVEDQSNTSFARPESIGLLMNFMDHVMARLGEERKTRAKDSLRAEENEKLAVLQREARSIVEVSESDALLSSLSAILDSPIMATVIDHGSKDRVSALLSPEAVYAVNQLYKDLVAAIASDDQIAISFADSAVLFDGLDLERKKLLSEKLISAVTRAENAGNFRRLSHLTALKNFISEVENYSDYMDNSPYKALVAEEKKTNLYLGTLAQLDQLIMGIYTNSALGLRLNELLIAWETLKELNGGKTFIYLKELTKENGFVHIAKILADNANTPILCAVKNLITKDDATARTVLVKYHGYDMRLINFSTDGNIAQLSRPGYAFTALFTPAEVSDLAQKQAELYTFICCIAELYKMRDSAGIVASAQFKEFLSLWTDGAGTYLDFPTKKHAAVFGANHIIPSYENRFKSYFDSKFYTKLDADFATAKNNFTNDELISHIDMKVTQIKVILKTLCSFLADFSKGGHPWVIQSLTDGVKSLSAALGNNNLKVACLKIYLDVLKDMKGAQAARENSPLYMLTVKKDMLLKKAGSADMGLETDDFNDFMACYNAVIEGDNVPEAVMSEAEEVRHQLHTVFSSAQFGSRVSMFGSRGTAVNEDTHSLRSRTTAVAEGTSRSPDRTSLSSKGRGEALSRTASVADYSIFSSGGRVSSVRVSPEAARDNRAGSDASSVRSSASTPAKKGAK